MQSQEPLNIGDVNYKKKTSRLTVILGVLAALMTIATIVLAILYGLDVGSSSTTNTVPPPPATQVPPSGTGTTTPAEAQKDICLDQGCITAASRILNAMDRTADPCDDFYQYACGTWVRDHIISADQSSISTFNDLRDDVSKVLKRVLETESTTDRDSIKKAKDFYASCMDTITIDGLGVDPVQGLISNMGGWPVLGDSFNDSSFVFEDVLATFRSEYGTYGIVSSWVSSDDKNSTANILQLDQPSLGMPSRDYYLDESLRNKTLPGYQQYMTDLMTMIADNPADTSSIEVVVSDIIQFETDLASSMAPDSERRDSFAIYNKMSLGELSKATQTGGNSINWTTYINKLLEVTDENLTVDDDEDVVVYDIKYLQNVSKIINERWELVQNYLVWRVLKDRTSFMSSDLRATRAPYTEATSGTTAEQERWKTCSDNTNDNFPMPTGSLFVQEVFPEENKAATDQLVKDIRTVFKEMLPDNDWMDEETKDAAAEKADLINPIIGYPDYIIDENNPKMDDDYQDVVVNVKEYFTNVQHIVQLGAKESFGKLRKPVDFQEWITAPAVVNAFYSPSRNQIVFPAGILQPPFYDQGQPMSMNYGGIGMVIGHEITHGFDDSGSQFDGYGNLNNWWTNSSKTNFNKRAQCMVDQYSSIAWETAGGEHLDGELTLGENIADNGGIREAYGAYKKWQESNPDGDLRLPGLDEFTQEQLFFLGNAQVWCGKYTPERALYLLKNDPHSPGVFRVIVPNQNFDKFGEAYGCKQGADYMFPDPADTCRVW